MTTKLNWLQVQKDLQPRLADGHVNSLIEYCENELKKFPPTKYHEILDKNLYHLIDPLILWVDKFYKRVSEDIDIEAMYCEMNGFTINPDLWFIDLFAFDTYEGNEDLDWLADWQDGHSTLADSFTITGLEKLQKVYENRYPVDSKGDYLPTTIEEDNSALYCEFLIVLRLQELFAKAFIIAKSKNFSWADIPIFVTAHDYTLTLEINGDN